MTKSALRMTLPFSEEEHIVVKRTFVTLAKGGLGAILCVSSLGLVLHAAALPSLKCSPVLSLQLT